jgi:oligopeptide/dipeptide ABC transporter ATP-binding protein
VNGPPTTGLDPGALLLEVTDLRTSFRSGSGRVTRAVDGVSLRIRGGETLGLVGESGCGKTATALSIMGLIPKPNGKLEAGSSVRFRGKELVDADPDCLRRFRGRHMAMIFQEPMTSLNPVLSVGEQVGEVLRTHRGMNRKQARDRTVALLAEVGIPDPRRVQDEAPHRLSGGMRQRVMIAMALAGEPELLIADEPTTALDVTIQAQLLELLDDLRERHGMAMLLITHDLGVVAEFCHRVAVMYAGHLVESAPVADIFGEPEHPYTRGLLESVPRLDRVVARLSPIQGTVPRATRWPGACRFAERCPHAWDLCRDEAPPTVERSVGGAERSVRCWLHTSRAEEALGTGPSRAGET